MTADSFVYKDADRAECLPLLPQGTIGRLLDVGCARGAFGNLLKRTRPGVDVWGIEPDPRAAAVAGKRLDHVIEGTYPDAIPPDEKFDVVTFFDVLEHVPDPWAVLRQTRRLLTDDGVVVASIPNVRHFSVLMPLVVFGRWDYAESGLLDRTHLRFFTRSTIQDLFESTEYEVTTLRPVISSPIVVGSKRWWLLRPLPAKAREGLLTTQYGVVARP